MSLRFVTRLVLVCSLAFSSVAFAGGPTDPGDLIDARRKAKDDPSQRAKVTVDFVLALAREAKATLSDDMAPGMKEKINLAATDVIELRNQKGQNDPEVQRLIKMVNDAAAEVKAALEYVKENKLASVKMPADVYTGADKAKIRAAVLALWASDYPAEKVLAVRFPNAKWERRKTVEKVGTEWKSYDVSSMSVRVIVDKSEEAVTIHGVIVQINHHKSEDLVVGRKGTFAPEDMARKNFKP